MAHSEPTTTLGPRDRTPPAGARAEPPATAHRRFAAVESLDRWAVALLVGIPILLNLPPALAGRPLLAGDNLSQNYPLRVLSGELLRHGRLPLWNPYIWSGTPLLAGWNAGAMYPGTWLFALLPGVAAWTINVVAVSVVCGIGMHVFLRYLGCSPLAALLGAATFTFTGYMLGQSSHLGLVAGMSFLPWMLLAVDGLARRPDRRAAAQWVALLGASGGLVVLAGDPRATSNVAIAVGVYLFAWCWRVPHRALGLVGWASAGAAVALACASVQMLPGLSFLHHSERAKGSLGYFSAGSLTWHDLSLLFVPFLFGGNGNFGLPRYAGSYNLPELSYAVGILPLVAAGALAWGAVRRRRGTSRYGVWYALGLVGIVLSAGGNTPLGSLLARLPLYGGQRLQNRNSVLVDLALAVLLALFVDRLSAPPADALPGTRARGADRASPTGPSSSTPPGLSIGERAAGLLPVAVVVFLIGASYLDDAWLRRAMQAPSSLASLAYRLTPYFAVLLAITAAAAALVVLMPRLLPDSRRRIAAAIVAADVLWAILNAAYSLPDQATIARVNSPAAALARIVGPDGRYAIFNPQQSVIATSPRLIANLGLDDLASLRRLLSVQGYGSAVAGSYESLTGAHEVQNLWPASLLGSTYDTLNLRALVTLRQYLISAIPAGAPIPVAAGTPVLPGTQPAAAALNAIVPLQPLPKLPAVLMPADGKTTWVLPGSFALDSTTIVLNTLDGRLPQHLTVTLLEPNNGHRTAVVPVVDGRAVLDVAGAPVLGVEVDAPRTSAIAVGALAVMAARPVAVNAGAPSRRLVLNGMLQGLLEPPRWRYLTDIDGLPVFTDAFARGPAWLEAAGATSADAPMLAAGTVATPARAPWQDPVTLVATSRAALLVRSASFNRGWTAKISPVGGGRSTPAAVREIGAVQAVQVPPGRWVVTWRYRSARATLGLALSVAGALAVLALLVVPRRRWRSHRSQTTATSDIRGS